MYKWKRQQKSYPCWKRLRTKLKGVNKEVVAVAEIEEPEGDVREEEEKKEMTAAKINNNNDDYDRRNTKHDVEE